MLATGDEDRLLLIPGPVPVAREILQALDTPPISHTGAQFAQIFGRCLERLAMVMGNESGKTFVFSGSGTLAQEAAIVNFVEPGGRLLVASNGYFADRLTEIAQAYRLEVIPLQAPWGTSVTAEELGSQMRRHRPTVVAFTHVETSTGAMARIADFVRIIREEGALSIVDGVAALGGVCEDMESLGIDVLLSGAQKALGMPPGLAILGVSPRAWSAYERRAEKPRAYYLDLQRWAPVMEDPQRYFSTHPINLIYALDAALAIIEREGLDARFDRHQTLAERFRGALLGLGLASFTEEACLAPTLSVFRLPQGQRSASFRQRLQHHGVIAAAGLSDPEGRVVRFGHMGNIGEGEVAAAIAAVQNALAG